MIEPERALGADEQVFQVVAGVVLAQAAQAVPQAAVGQYDLQAEAEFARIAIAQHLHSTGIGGEIAADGGGAFGGKREREEAAGAGGGFLHRSQRAAGFDGQGVVVGVDGANAVEAGEAHQHFAADGGGATTQARVAALRHNRNAGGGTGLHDSRNFFGSARLDYAKRLPGVTAAPVGAIRGNVEGGGENVRRADNFAQAFQKVGAHGTAEGVSLSVAYRS